ncbi:class I SAM-dependent methyltransferase [Rhodococcus sp. 077-4]|uniref:class I SAM-dependent methyltransferase n=1 Tax=Rhodococcus sp. 077-4 TaxID=2789271 RepID=UPI0039F48A1A
MLGDLEVSRGYQQNAAYWERVVRQRLDKFQTEVTDVALLDLIGDCTGASVLDAGCGEGYFARDLIARGAAHVAGVDTCAELIIAAREHPESGGHRADYHHADVADMPLGDASVDVVVANRLPHGIADPAKRFEEFQRVLRPAGRLIVLSMHPCFYAARGDREGIGFASTIDDYFGVRTVQQRFDVAGLTSPAASFQQFYSLEEHIGMITAAGFAITSLREPRPSAEQRRSDTFWATNFTRPLFMLLECTTMSAE